MKIYRLLLGLLLLCGISLGQSTTRTFPALDTNNTFTGTNQFSDLITSSTPLVDVRAHANIQAAVNFAAGLSPKGVVLIPYSYAGVDSYTNASNVRILDYRRGPCVLGLCDVTMWGAVGNAKISVVASGSGTTITCSDCSFTAADVGKQFSWTPTQYSTTGQLTGTISAFISSTQVTASATVAGTNVQFIYGTDDTAAFNSAVTYVQSLTRGGDGGNINNPLAAEIPTIEVPPPSGFGYLITSPINVTKEGVAFTSMGREAAQLVMNTTTASLNFTAPSGTYHGLYVDGISIECGYIANSGLILDSIEESLLVKIRANHCMNQGVKLTNTTGTNGLTTFIDFREAGNVIGVLNNSAQQTVFYHCNIYGSSNNSNTLVGMKMTGSHVINEFDGCWMEGLQTDFQVDNTSANNVSVISFKNGRILSTVTGFHFISASSQNVNNTLLLNAVVDTNEIQTTASTNWNDLLMNSNVAAGSGINIAWINNLRDSGPTAKVFNTDSSLTHIIYSNNNGVNGANISTGAGVVFGFDCGSEFQLGPDCQVRSRLWSISSLGAAAFPSLQVNGGQTVTGTTGTGANIVTSTSPSITTPVLGQPQISGATPTASASQLGLGITTGFGNGAAGTAVTTTLKNTGSGPTTPQTVTSYIKINVGGTDFWIPLVQ